MSSRIPISSRYGLRSRKGQTEEIPDRSESELTDVSTKSTPVGHLSRPASAASRRSYSEVVAAHIPVETVRPTETTSGSPENGPAAETVQSDEKIAKKKGIQADTPDDDDSSTWTTVTRGNRRSHSVSSLDRRRNTLNVEQMNSIDSAYNNLSKEERQKLSRREARINIETSADNHAPSPRDIPPKGKNPDPRNWGNLNFAAEELDPIAQARAFASWKAAQARRRPDTGNIAGGSRDHVALAANPDTQTSETNDRERLHQRLIELERENDRLKNRRKRSSRTPITDGVRDHIKKATANPTSKSKKRSATKKADKSGFLPSSQIPPNSFLGRALNSVDKPRPQRSRRRKDPSDDEDSSDSSSSSSSGDESYPNESSGSSDDFSSSSSSSDDSDGRRRRQKRSRRSKTKPKSSLKPTPPEAYDGKADLTAFL